MIFIPIAKNTLAISSDLRAISVQSMQPATLREKKAAKEKSSDYDLNVESDSSLLKAHPANSEQYWVFGNSLECSLGLIYLKNI